MSRAGAEPRHHAAAIRRQWLRRTWWVYAVATLFIGLCVAVPVLLAPQTILLGVALGGTALGFILGDTLQHDGARTWRDGAYGEESTGRVLKRLRRNGFRIAHNVPFEHRDIDHVLVGERGLVAVESKYTHVPWTVTPQGIVETKTGGRRHPVPYPVDQARRSARHLRLLALSAKVRTEVTPVVVLWGPGVTAVDAGARWVEGVLIAVGKQAREWLDVLDGDPLTGEQVQAVWAAVQARKAEHRPHGADRWTRAA